MNQEQLDEELPLLKIIIVGQSGVGKSNILYRYVYDKFYVGNNATIGFQFVTKKMTVREMEINLQIWDTAGQQRFRSLNRAFYRNALGGIMVFSLGDRHSFERLPKWIEQVKQGISENPILILVGNKCDLKEQLVTVQEATEFAKQNKMAYFQASAALNININTIFQKLSSKVYDVYQKKQQPPRLATIIHQDPKDQQRKKRKCCE